MHMTQLISGSCRTKKGESSHSKYQQKLCDECSEMYQQINGKRNGKQVTCDFCNRLVVQQNFENHQNTKTCLNVRIPPDIHLKQCSRCKQESDE